jgi:serine/threonine-protein phosphatase 2A activator
MIIGEVVEKRVVVQGLWVGGWCWGPNLPEVMPKAEKAVSNPAQGVTKAPWAR